MFGWLDGVFFRSCGADDSDSDADELEIEGVGPPPPSFELIDAADHDLRVALMRGFFSKDDIARVHAIGSDSSLEEIDDRSDELVYKHNVWRIEKQLKVEAPKIYRRLMQCARGLDGELWNALHDGDVVFPEIEYIVYNVLKLGEPGTISPHRDNDSMVTMVVLLSPPSDFVGGINCFESGDDDDDEGEDRSVRLQQGDAVFFYGDKLQHWITPVTSGERVILQMELSRGRKEDGCTTSLPNMFKKLCS